MKTFFFAIAVQAGFAANGQNIVSLSGQVFDAITSKPLSYANISVQGIGLGTQTNDHGRFSLNIPAGKTTVLASFIGYETASKTFLLKTDTSVIIKLTWKDVKLEEVKIKEEAFLGERNLNSSQMSIIDIDPKQVQMIPNIAGEQDIIKVAQLLPGVSKGIEGGSDYFVRGGNADQNLLLLDGSTMYNTGHLFGFISVFNPDVIGKTTFIKGAFPANYGGRLSSIYDINTKNNIPDKTEFKASIGLISSRLTIRQPIINNKLSVMVAGRRTYIDKVVLAVNGENQVPYYFYDVNGRIDYKPDTKNHFFVSSYIGDDILQYKRGGNSQFKSNFIVRSNTQNAGWRHSLSDTKVSQLNLARTYYGYQIDNTFYNNSINTRSGIEDLTLRYSFETFKSNNTSTIAGIELQNHSISPIAIASEGLFESVLPDSRSNSLNFIEGGLFYQINTDISNSLRASVGYRQSVAKASSSTYWGYEPRFSMRWKNSSSGAFKMSYTRSYQYMHRVSSSAVSLPVDLWYGVTNNIKPQTSDQIALGHVQTIPKYGLLIENEVYYKTMNRIIDYKEGTNLLLNSEFESALLQGWGNSYGYEVLMKREGNKWQGWVSYALSWSNRRFDELNQGKTYPAKYDRRHNISIVGQINLTKRIVLSSIWEYISGSRFTPIISQYSVLNPSTTGFDIVNIYSDRNAVSMSPTHRLDLLIIIKGKTTKKYRTELYLGVYNVYNRATPVAINVSQNSNGDFIYEQPGIFGTIPTVSYHVSF